MFCPHINNKCTSDCAFSIGRKCLQAEYYKCYIQSQQEASLMMKTIFPTLANLPLEVREKLPDNIREQIEDIMKRMPPPGEEGPLQEA